MSKSSRGPSDLLKRIASSVSRRRSGNDATYAPTPAPSPNQPNDDFLDENSAREARAAHNTRTRTNWVGKSISLRQGNAALQRQMRDRELAFRAPERDGAGQRSRQKKYGEGPLSSANCTESPNRQQSSHEQAGERDAEHLTLEGRSAQLEYANAEGVDKAFDLGSVGASPKAALKGEVPPAARENETKRLTVEKKQQPRQQQHVPRGKTHKNEVPSERVSEQHATCTFCEVSRVTCDGKEPCGRCVEQVYTAECWCTYETLPRDASGELIVAQYGLYGEPMLPYHPCVPLLFRYDSWDRLVLDRITPTRLHVPPPVNETWPFGERYDY